MSEISNKEWITHHLSAVPFVQWDRFTHDEWSDGQEILTAYGWIDRDADAYKDFLIITFWPEIEEIVFTTSSDRYSLEIQERLLGHRDDHNTCKRIEHHFDVANAVTVPNESG